VGRGRFTALLLSPVKRRGRIIALLVSSVEGIALLVSLVEERGRFVTLLVKGRVCFVLLAIRFVILLLVVVCHNLFRFVRFIC